VVFKANLYAPQGQETSCASSALQSGQFNLVHQNESEWVARSPIEVDVRPSACTSVFYSDLSAGHYQLQLSNSIEEPLEHAVLKAHLTQELHWGEVRPFPLIYLTI
jgi:hypothetical protein